MPFASGRHIALILRSTPGSSRTFVLKRPRKLQQSTELSTSPESTFIQLRRRSSAANNLLTLKEANSRTNNNYPATSSASSLATSSNDVQPRLQRPSLDSAMQRHFQHGSFALQLNKISENGDVDDNDDDIDEHAVRRCSQSDEPSADKTECSCMQGDSDELCACQEHRILQQQQQFDSASSTCDSIENIPMANNRFQQLGTCGDSPLASPRRQQKLNADAAQAGYRNVGGYLIAVHRKLSRQDTYFLSYHKTRPSLFGVPLLIPCYQGGSNKDLYCAVWVQVARLLSPLPSTPPDQLNHATDW